MMSVTRSFPDAQRAQTWQAEVGQNRYRWVMMAVWFVMMSLNSITLTSYPLALPELARQFRVEPATYAYYAGILSYSLGLFVVYFANLKSWMTLHVRLAIGLAQLVMVLPSFLMPLAPSYPTIVVLRFIQGLWFIELGLATIQLKGWFGRSQIALALAAPLSALVVGSAVGGLLEKVLVSTSGWRMGDDVTALATLIATALFFALYRDAPGYRDFLCLSRQRARAARSANQSPPPWRLKVAYTIGLSQLATTMAFASIPFLVPAVGVRHRDPTSTVASVVLGYGLVAAGGVIAGALLGDRLTMGAGNPDATFQARNLTRTIAQILSFVGFMILLFDSRPVIVYALGAMMAALILFDIPNYWAEMGEVTPPSESGDFIFFSGALASSGFFIGPLLSITLIVFAHQLGSALILFLVVIAVSEAVNLWQNRLALPIDRYSDAP